MEDRGVLHTEAARLYISLFTSGRIRVRVAQRGPCADLQILVQTPLLRAGEAGLGRLVWYVQAEDRGIFSKAYTCHSNENLKGTAAGVSMEQQASSTVPTFAETCGLPFIERGGCRELAIPV